MGKFIDLTGQVFNRLTVLYKIDKRGNEWYWHCRCECGNECDVAGASLRAGRTKSCGCLKKETDRASKNNWDDLTGKKFGHLTAIERVQSDKYGHAKWKCVCDCEAHTEIIVYADNLKKGHTQSCGCDRRSHGELKVEQILRENNIPFVQEYHAFKFSSGRWATFDFMQIINIQLNMMEKPIIKLIYMVGIRREI